MVKFPDDERAHAGDDFRQISDGERDVMLNRLASSSVTPGKCHLLPRFEGEPAVVDDRRIGKGAE